LSTGSIGILLGAVSGVVIVIVFILMGVLSARKKKQNNNAVPAAVVPKANIVDSQQISLKSLFQQAGVPSAPPAGSMPNKRALHKD
jgi:hypothetical protein